MTVPSMNEIQYLYTYICFFNFFFLEWYRGVITDVFPTEMTLTIRYDDGDFDTLSPYCLRRFVPYRIDEEVEYHLDGGGGDYIWYMGKIINENDQDFFDVETEDGQILRNISAAQFRRSESFFYQNIEGSKKLKVGVKIRALFEGGSLWFPGKIVNDNEDGTYDVEYDDGDFESGVSYNMIQLVS